MSAVLTKQYRLMVVIGEKPKTVTATAEQEITVSTIAEAKRQLPFLMRADLVIVNGKVAEQDYETLLFLVHEAGYIYAPEASKEQILDSGFTQITTHLYQRGEGNTPVAYDDRYLSRWGDLDFMHNWKMSGEQILVHMPKGKTKETARILDVGCLNGYIMESLRRCGAKQVFGCDISYELAIRSQVDPYHLPTITIGDFIQNDYPDKISDMTICMEVLEHLPPANTDGFIEQLKRVTTNDGVILISTSEDWDADPTHLNCRSRREWFYILAQHDLVPAKRRQLIYGGFNSFIVKKARNGLQAGFFKMVYGLLYKIERWRERSYRQSVALRLFPWLRTKGQISFSSLGEDLVIRDVFQVLGKPKPSYFVAATEYQKYPAIFKDFQLFGSRGIFIHPNQQSINRFPYRRQRDMHIAGDLRDKGDMTISTILKEKWKGHFPEILFLEMGKKNLKLMKSIQFATFGPSVMCIATGNDDTAIADYASEVHYQLIGKTRDYQIFAQRDIAHQLAHA